MNVYMSSRNITKNFRLLIIIIVLFFFSLQLASIDRGSHSEFVSHKTLLSDNRFLIELSETRLNRLFGILHKKEKAFKQSLEDLQVLSFSDLINEGINNSNLKFGIKNDIVKYIEIQNQEIKVKKKFVADLINKSIFYSFEKSRIRFKAKDRSNVI